MILPLGAENSVKGSDGPGSHPGTQGPEGKDLKICCACAMASALCCWLIRYNCATVILETSRFVNTFGRIALAEVFAPAGSNPLIARRGTRLAVEKRVDLPAAQHLANKSTLLCEEWQFVNDIPGKSIRPIIT